MVETEEENGRKIIVDGQHRLGACAHLSSKGKGDAVDGVENVLVEVNPEHETREQEH